MLQFLGAQERAREFLESARAPATVRAYRGAWRDFNRWCAANGGLVSLPAAPETIALYLSAIAGKRSIATIQLRITAISQAHRTAGEESPTRTALVSEVWRGIRRTYGVSQERKAPIRLPELVAMLETLDRDAAGGRRTAAMLIVGFAAALRRSELTGLDVGDLQESDEGLLVVIRRSKTDPFGAGDVVGVPRGISERTCPVRATASWRECLDGDFGPWLRPVDRHGNVGARRLSSGAVARIVKRTAADAGLDAERYSGHSLRAGLITSAAEAGVREADIMRHSRHRSVQTVRIYVRRASVWDDNAAAAVGL